MNDGQSPVDPWTTRNTIAVATTSEATVCVRITQRCLTTEATTATTAQRVSRSKRNSQTGVSSDGRLATSRPSDEESVTAG